MSNGASERYPGPLAVKAGAGVADASAAAAALQRRVRSLNQLLRKGEPYHVEIDAIASELGTLSMELQGWAPVDHRVWRPNANPTPITPAPAGRVEFTPRRD